MPVDNGVGWSDTTQEKLDQFRQIVGTHLMVVDKIIAKYQREGWDHYPAYLYFDMNAGPGRYGGMIGSPLLQHRQAERLAVPNRSWMFEIRPESAVELSANLENESSVYGSPVVVVGDHEETAPIIAGQIREIGPPAFGLVYADPNATLLPIAAIRSLVHAPRRSRIDVLIYVSATTYKRVVGAGFRVGRLLDDLAAIGKRHVWLREPTGRHQWTFAILSDWDGHPEFRNIGFHRLGTPGGDALALRLNFTTSEARRDGPPFDQPPTEPTPNTSLRQSFAPSAPSSYDGPTAAASGVGSPRQLKFTT